MLPMDLFCQKALQRNATNSPWQRFCHFLCGLGEQFISYCHAFADFSRPRFHSQSWNSGNSFSVKVN
ncbi:hypothetical protein IC805_13170 [Geobacillus thermoleovorans]|uniref:hypothetical protein n=1 Tax=Geobacillus thermoleovorans TaxID=33941 RepID=UPI0016801403|nr:hypothetical protein [Geobacillus thermoleovorans]QNU20470.1 hypothetical protein IC805_13170 [Geobacillus thermoleovorans]